MGKSKDLATGNSAAYVETAGDTMSGALTVTGNVGIDTGTITPRDSGASTLQIGGNGTRSAIKMHTSSSGIGATDGLFLGYDSGPHFYILNSEANGDIKIGTSNSVDRLLIDASGRVTKPNQPSFAAYVQNASTYDANSLGNAYVNYDTDLYDTGNNHSNGLFTAPVAGVYYFRAEAYTDDYCTQSWFVVNGSRTNAADTVYTGNDQFSGNSIILKLAANDTVGFHPYRYGYTSVTVQANANHSWFRGILLG
jgi:hypothetical protein